jgi:hypothetical protein
VIKLFQWQHHTLLHGLKAMKMVDAIGTMHVGQSVETENRAPNVQEMRPDISFEILVNRSDH